MGHGAYRVMSQHISLARSPTRASGSRCGAASRDYFKLYYKAYIYIDKQFKPKSSQLHVHFMKVWFRDSETVSINISFHIPLHICD